MVPVGVVPDWPPGHHAGNQRHQAENVAAVQRHFQHFARFDHLAQRGVLRLQQRSLRRHLDDLADIADVIAESIRTALCTSTVMGSREKRRKPVFSTSTLYWPGTRLTN